MDDDRLRRNTRILLAVCVVLAVVAVAWARHSHGHYNDRLCETVEDAGIRTDPDKC